MADTLEPIGAVRYTGIDVSEYQGAIDFARVRAAGKDAVYIRAGVGSDYIDPRLDDNHAGAVASGLAVGFYHFMTGEDDTVAREQARFFVDITRSLSQDLRPAMDFGTQMRNMTRARANQLALAFLDEVRSYGGKTGAIYTDASAARTTWSRELATSYPLWVADWGAPAPEYNDVWPGWSGWQYSDDGRVDGIEGDVDLDYFTENLENEDPSPVPGTPTRRIDRDQTLICVTVVRGDTLSAIARRYNTTVRSLVRLNAIRDPNLIVSGQSLYVLTDQPGSATCCDSYLIRRGDTLSGIAYRFSTTVARLAAINEIRNPNLIIMGRSLKLGLCNT